MKSILSMIGSNAPPGEKINLTGREDFYILKTDEDPRVGDGINVPEGSIAILNNSAVTHLFIKNGPDISDWSDLSTEQGAEVIVGDGSPDGILLEDIGALFYDQLNEELYVSNGGLSWTKVSGQVELSLDELTDVDVSGVTDNQVLSYNQSESSWEPSSLELNSLSDLNIIDPEDEQILIYNESVNQWESKDAEFIPYVPGVGLFSIPMFANTDGDELAETSLTFLQSSTTVGIRARLIDGNLLLGANGIGAVVAQIPDGLESGGNERGQYSLDLQRVRASNLDVASGTHSFILGGLNNRVSAANAGIINGQENSITGFSPFGLISNGSQNSIVGERSFIGTGILNSITGNYSSIINGDSNQVIGSGFHNFIGSGIGNIISDEHVFIGGGSGNSSDSSFTFIGHGLGNIIQDNSARSAIICGESNNLGASYGFIAGGIGNVIEDTGTRAAVICGRNNTAGAANSFIGTGQENEITSAAEQSAIVAGVNNIITRGFAFIGSGDENLITGLYSGIATGNKNSANSPFGFIGSGNENSISSTNSFIGSGTANIISAGQRSFIGCGRGNTISDEDSCIVGGDQNNISGMASFIGGGSNNNVDPAYCVITGGLSNVIRRNSIRSSILGGRQHEILQDNHDSVIAGGIGSISSAPRSVVLGSGAQSFNFGELAFATATFSNTGDSQATKLMWRGNFNTAAIHVLTLDGASEEFTLLENSVYKFKIQIAGVGLVSGDVGWWEASGAIKRIGATITFAGTVNITAGDDNPVGWDFDVSIVSNRLRLSVEQDAQNIRWVATADCIRIAF